MRLHYFQHISCENLGSIEPWAKQNNFDISSTKFHEKNPALPELDSFDWLVILGGPMNVDDEQKHPWLIDEKKCIEEAIQNNKVVIGICLGAQLIAQVLGAQVNQNEHKEIGWFSTALTTEGAASPFCASLPSQFKAFHWHGDMFDIPSGAIRLARSEACPNQGFFYGNRIIGLQFHLEFTDEIIRNLIDCSEEELHEDSYIQSPAAMTGQTELLGASNDMMHTLLTNCLNSNSIR